MNRARLASLSTPLVAALALSGCTVQPEQEAAVNVVGQSLALQMGADSQYMARKLDATTAAKLATGERVSMKIDLADPSQHRLVMNRLAAAGKNADNSPHLFERLHVAKSAAIARATAGKLGATTAAAVRDNWCDNVMQLGNEVKTSASTIQFRTTKPNVTCVNGAAYVFTDINTYNSNIANTENFLVGSAAGEDYSGGTNFTAVAIQPTLPAVMGRVNRTDSMVIAFDDVGNEQMTFHSVQTNMVEIPGTITVAHPTFHPWIANGGNVQMCQLRGLPNMCDYAVGQMTGGVFTGWTAATTGIAAVAANTGTPTVPWAGDAGQYFQFPAAYNAGRIYLPIEGTFDTGATTAGNCLMAGTASVLDAKLELIKTIDGGACNTTSTFKASVVVPANSRTGSFRAIAEFVNDGGTVVPGPNTPDCSLASIINEAVKPVISVRAMANCAGTNQLRNMRFGPDGMTPALNRLMFFLNSCFAEGTPVKLANGKTTTVEKIKSGDKVISDAKGTVLTVTGTSYGREADALVALKDNLGHELKLTAKHPLIKASGEVVFASSLKVGDQVKTERGVAEIVSTERVKYDGQVYNLALGTAEEKAKVGKDGTTLFAGGFLAGDSVMQKDHETKRSNVAQLSTSWARDYKHAVANNPPIQRVLR